MAIANSPFGLPSVSPDNPLAPEYLALERQKKIADLLMQKGQQLPEGQMVSGHYVAPSFTQQLNPLLNAYMGGNMAEQTEQKTAKLAQMLRGQQEQTVQSFINAKTPAEKFAVATSSNAPSWLQSLGADMLKSQKVGEGEVISQLNLATGQQEPILKGNPKDTRTEKQKDYEYYIANTGKNITFDQYIDRITPVEQQRLNNERRRIELEENKLIDEGVPITPSSGTSPVVGTFPLSRGVNDTHAGIDIKTPVNTPIVATTEGVVRYNTKDKSGYGNMIEIVDPKTNQVKARYAHLNAFDVPEGTTVKPGQVLGKTGGVKGDVGAGNSTGPHLHYEDLTKPPSNLSPKQQRELQLERAKEEFKPPTEFAGKAVLFGSAMQQSENIIKQLEKEGTTKGAIVPAFISGIVKLAPLGVGDAAANAVEAAFRADPTGFVGPDKNQQKLAQAQLAFATAWLRQTSGANFGASEIANTIKEFFPLQGESSAVITQKTEARNRAIEGLKYLSGPSGTKQIEKYNAPSESSINPELFKYMTPEQQALFKQKPGK
jgi:murein DD-endopeptidase MepM/ murein hydrolase activator NlpD